MHDATGEAAAAATRDVIVDSVPDLALGLSAGSEPVEPSGLITYELVYTHRGATGALDAKLSMPLPDGTSFVSASGGGTLTGGAVEWSLGPLAPQASGEQTLTVQVTATSGEVVDAWAQVFDTLGAVKSARASSVAAVRASRPLTLSVSASPDPVDSYDPVVYALTVTNTSGVSQTGLILDAVVPANMQVTETEVTDSGDCLTGNTCSEGDVVRWSLGTLLAGGSRTVVMTPDLISSTPDGNLLTLAATVHDATGEAAAAATRDVIVDSGACGKGVFPPLVANAGPLAGVVCGGSATTYFFDVSAGQKYTVKLTPTTGDPDLYGSATPSCIESIPMLQGGCTYEGSWSAGLVAEEIHFTAGVSGKHFLGIYGYADSTYTIEVLAESPAAEVDIAGGAVVPGESTTFDASASAGGTTGCAISSYAWDFGDGTTVTCPGDAACDVGNAARVAHSYADAGTYTASLEVTDCNAVTATKTFTVAVTGTSSGTAANDSALSDDPVNLATGSFYETTQDLHIAGRGGFDLVFSRSYNSQDKYFQSGAPLGFGWTHSFNARWIGDPSTSVTVLFEDGHGETYTANGDTTFAAEAAIFNELVENPDGSLTLTRKNQSRYELDSAGRLAAIADRNGNTVACGYDGQDRLTTLTDTVGRTLSLSYDGSDRLTGISDPLGRTWSYAYDGAGDLISYTDPELGITQYTYDADHQITQILDPRGNPRATNAYDAFSRVVASQQDALSNTTSFVYDFASRTTTVTDALGNETRYAHDKDLRLTDLRDAIGHSEHFTFDDDGNRTQVTDRNGNTTAYTYDSRGNVTGKTDTLGNSTSITYDSTNNPVTRTDAFGSTWTFAHDGNGNLTQTDFVSGTEVLSVTTSAVYDGSGQLTSATDGNGHTSIYGYDAEGNLTSATDPLTNATTYSHDAVGRRLTRTDANGHTATWAYDDNDRVTSLIDPGLGATLQGYDANGNLTSSTDPRGKTTTRLYDAKDRLTKVTNPLLGEVSYAYDALDRRTFASDANDRITQFAYDGVGNLTFITDAAGKITTHAYDAAGNRISTTDPLTHTTFFTFDALDRLVKIVDPESNVTAHTYDSNNRRISTTDANENLTSFGYDGLDRMISVTDAMGVTSFYSFDDAGNQVSVTDPRGNVTNFIYDDSNRLIQKADPLLNTTAYAYDGVGNLTTLTNGSGQNTVYGYDANDRLASELAPDRTVTFAYDANGNCTQMVDANGTSVYVYDDLNRLTQTTDAFGKTVSHGYDATGNRTSITYPGGDVVQYSYDVLNRLETVTDWLTQTTTYAYDNSGRLTGGTLPNGSTVVYDYDDADRTVALTNRAPDLDVVSSYTFNLDGMGNITGETRNEPLSPTRQGEKDTYTYDVSNQTLDRITPNGLANNYSYDASGNLTEDDNGTSEKVYTYDPRNQLASHSQGGQLNAHVYDGVGHRIARVENGVATRFVLDTSVRLFQVLQETDADGTPTASYVYGLGLIERIDASDNARTYHYNLRGNTIAITDPTGTVTDSYAYNPFGKAIASSGSTPNRFSFTGQAGVQADSDGLMFVRARHYAPGQGRFLQRDRVEGVAPLPQTWNSYAYAVQNPVHGRDVNGEFPDWIGDVSSRVGEFVYDLHARIPPPVADSLEWTIKKGTVITAQGACVVAGAGPVCIRAVGAAVGGGMELLIELADYYVTGDEIEYSNVVAATVSNGAGTFWDPWSGGVIEILADMAIREGIDWVVDEGLDSFHRAFEIQQAEAATTLGTQAGIPEQHEVDVLDRTRKSPR